VDALQLRRWVQDKRAAEARERLEARSAPPSGEAIAQALALVALYGRLHGWPAPEDEVTRREDAGLHERWRRLRIALRRAP
jgi:hypothetical protein